MKTVIVLTYLLGVVLHELFKWNTWKKGNLEQPWLAYWKRNTPEVIGSAIVSIVFMFLWEQGILQLFIQRVLGAVFVVEIDPIRTTPTTSVFAGWLLDSLGKHLVVAFPTRLATAN